MSNMWVTIGSVGRGLVDSSKAVSITVVSFDNSVEY